MKRRRLTIQRRPMDRTCADCQRRVPDKMGAWVIRKGKDVFVHAVKCPSEEK